MSVSACKILINTQVNGVVTGTLDKLQSFVRAQFMCLSKSHWTPPMQDLVSSLVEPALVVPTNKCWNTTVVHSAHVIAERLRSNSLTTVQDLNLKLACKVASGCLDQHPIVQGILCAAVEQASRQERGITSMKGLKLSDLELSRMSEAGVALSCAASNRRLLQEFGLQFTVPRLPLSNLHGFGLAEPFIALRDPAALANNARLCFQTLSLQTGLGTWGLGFPANSL